MGESLFIIFALLAKTPQFLIDLQTYQLLIFIGHGMIDCPEQFEPDVLLSNVGLKAENFMRNVSAL